MQRKDRGLIGVELCLDELRAVYVRHGDGGVEVAAASFVSVPDGCLVKGSIAQPSVVGTAFKRLLEELEAPAGTEAVIGIPSDGVTVRTMNVPPAPDAELPEIVAGEVEHYRMLPSKGSHAFISLNPPEKEGPVKARSVVVAAIDERLTRSLGEIASRANVRLTAVEPVEFGMLRSAATFLDTDEPEFVMLIGRNSTDLVAFARGDIWSYRRVDFGVGQLLPEGPKLRLVDETEELPTHEIRKYSSGTLDALCGQVDRSIDYLGREYKEQAQFPKLYVCVADATVADIAPQLAERIALPVEIIPPCSGSLIEDAVEAKIAGAEGLRYSAAFGLAMREYMPSGDAFPLIDLFAADRARADSKAVRRNVTGSLTTSAAAVIFGAAGYFLYGHEASLVRAQVNISKGRAESLQSEASAETAKHRARHRQIVLLSDHGLPEQALLDAVATSIEPGVGIESLAIASDRTVMLTADAMTETTMLSTVKRIQSIPILQDVMIQTFANKGSSEAGLAFTISAKTLPVSQIRVLPPPKVYGFAKIPDLAAMIRRRSDVLKFAMGEAGK